MTRWRSRAGSRAGRCASTKCKTIDLEIPADAEIVVEGLIDTELLEPEGPFGESHGHIALEDFNMSMRVTAITMKKKPVFASILSEVTPSESSILKKSAYEALFFAHLRNHLEVKGIKRVVMHEPLTNLRKVLFLEMAHGAPQSEVWRALNGAATLQAQCGKIVIAVSEDIDARNTDAIFWSLAYRFNPIADTLIVPLQGRRAWPEGRGQAGGEAESSILIDATLKHTTSPLALPAQTLHGALAPAVGGARPAASAARAAAVARLRPRRLGARLAGLRRQRDEGRLGGERHQHLRAPQGRPEAGDAGQERGEERVRSDPHRHCSIRNATISTVMRNHSRPANSSGAAGLPVASSSHPAIGGKIAMHTK